MRAVPVCRCGLLAPTGYAGAARPGSGGAAAGLPAATKSRGRTSAYPATQPTAATATLTSAIVLKPVTNA